MEKLQQPLFVTSSDCAAPDKLGSGVTHEPKKSFYAVGDVIQFGCDDAANAPSSAQARCGEDGSFAPSGGDVACHLSE